MISLLGSGNPEEHNDMDNWLPFCSEIVCLGPYPPRKKKKKKREKNEYSQRMGEKSGMVRRACLPAAYMVGGRARSQPASSMHNMILHYRV
jgi:hypothetical protein